MSVLSTLGKKIFMGLTGLLLCAYIVEHLIGNLQLLSSNRDPFNIYAHFLTQEIGAIIYVAEFLLAAVFVVHFIYAIMVTWENWKARPKGYSLVRWARHTSRRSVGSVTMIYTGIVVAAFVIWHLAHFKYGAVYMYTPQGYDHQIRDMYETVYRFYSNEVNVILYVLIMGLLGFHLSHGFWSAFQSLGLDGKRFTPVIYVIGSIFAVVMAVGFIIIPIYVYFSATGGAV